MNSEGEGQAQRMFGTARRAAAFHRNQMTNELNDKMQSFIARQEMVFLSTANANGECDCSYRAGTAGFVRVLNAKMLAYPEYRGNGVMASVGNILENPRIGLLFIDFLQSTVGLHVNGQARVMTNEEVVAIPVIPQSLVNASHMKGGQHPECWVMVEVDEAYIHCSKHVPLMKKVEKELHWGTDDECHKGGDFFQVQSNQSNAISSEE
ncbi:pyridoxamine 5'-phosphate oxidase family protein [Candidatus Nitrospira allomarina]|uniref:Pyridoxamine 5'-phosphate oxidase family protein n=1 Tax=Candidatus Nitrospira allomarina TaxID=3020900 RepID=A0AA96JRK6_9BACT|nr:pyridoxamine 5'-phosphate oxidase family protein [Candidatus Nitrospira allomarina]WNM57612.1 pyridoxamine 5'-phosphate oxidase family protein [Candidatus Nitrospira allomarina]